MAGSAERDGADDATGRVEGRSGAGSRREVLRVLAAFVVALAAADLLAGSDWLFRDGEGAPLGQLVRKATQARARRPGVLVLGDSTGYHDIDAARLGALLHRRAYNAAVPSGSPLVMRWIVDRLERLPRDVVFGVSPLLLIDDYEAEPREWDAATVRERLALRPLAEAVLESGWGLFRRRHSLQRRFLQVLGYGRGPLDVHEGPERDDGSNPLSGVLGTSRAHAAGLLRKWCPPGGPTKGVRLRAARELVERLERAGSRVTWVTMPVPSTMRAAMRARGLDRVATALAREATTARTRRLDLREAFEDEAFYDSDHMRAGPQRSSVARLLADALRERR